MNQRLYRLAQAHVVRETRAQSPSAEETQPPVAALLIWAQHSAKAGRGRQLLDAAVSFELLEKPAQPAVGSHAADLDAVDGRRIQRHPHRVLRGHPAGSALEQSGRTRNLLGVEQYPLASRPDQRRQEGGRSVCGVDWKNGISGRCVGARRETGPSERRGKGRWTETGLKPCTGRPSGLYRGAGIGDSIRKFRLNV